jgi:hypothetical protein
MLPLNRNAVRLILSLALFSLLIACQRDEKPKITKRPPISETHLYKINKSAAFIKFDVESSQKTNCMLAKITGNSLTKNNDTKSSLALKSMLDENENLCNFYTETVKIVNPEFDAIEKNGFVPKELYVLTVISYSYDKDATLQKIYEENVVGLFKSLKNCETVKSLSQKFNIPNKGCKKWNEKEF